MKKDNKKPLEKETENVVAAVDIAEAIESSAADSDIKSDKKPAKEKKKFNMRNFKHGTLSFILTLVFIAVVVVFNVVVGLISDRFDTEVDLTASGVYTLEEKTEEYIKSVNKEITITVLNSETNFEALGDPYKQVNELLKKMSIANPLIKIEYLLLDQNPGYAADFQSGEIADNYIVVQCPATKQRRVLVDDLNKSLSYGTEGEGYITVNTEEYYNAYMAYYYYGSHFDMYDYLYSNIEQDVVSALMFVTNEDPVRIAFTEGYNESDSTALQSLLSDNGYGVETINLAQVDAIDPDIDFVIMYAPTIDVDTDNLTKLDKFLDNGGAFGKNVMYFASVDQPETPNIELFLNDWGLSIGNSIIMQKDNNYRFVFDTPTIPHSHFQQICDTLYAGDVFASSLYTYGAYMRPVIQIWDGGTKGNVEQEIIVQSYDNAYLYPLTATEDFAPESAEAGVFNNVIAAYRIHSSANEPSRLVVFGSDMLTSKEFLSYGNANNSMLIVNMFNYISGKEKGITIKPKSFATTGFDMTQQQADTLAIFLCIVIPVVVIAIGIVIWVRRRHR